MRIPPRRGPARLRAEKGYQELEENPNCETFTLKWPTSHQSSQHICYDFGKEHINGRNTRASESNILLQRNYIGDSNQHELADSTPTDALHGAAYN